MTNQFIICLSKVAQDNQRNTSEECYLWEINVEINLRSLRNDIYWHCVTTTWRKMVFLIYFSIFYLFISHLGNYCGVFLCFFFLKLPYFVLNFAQTNFRAFSRVHLSKISSEFLKFYGRRSFSCWRRVLKFLSARKWVRKTYTIIIYTQHYTIFVHSNNCDCIYTPICTLNLMTFPNHNYLKWIDSYCLVPIHHGTLQ